MAGNIIIDTGPIVAFLISRDEHHHQVVQTMDTLSGPLLTCEAVLSEAFFLLEDPRSRNGLGELLEAGIVAVGLDYREHRTCVHHILKKYSNLHASFADACLVCMAKKMGRHIFTLDSDFNLYRDPSGNPLPLVDLAG